MRYIVDTSIWSLALRKKTLKANEELAVKKLRKLIDYGEHVFITGIILQEILQGIKNRGHFERVKKVFLYYEVLNAHGDDHVYAAELFNKCRSKGVTASTVDFLIAAIAIKNDCRLFTADKDFECIARYTELQVV